MGPKTRRQAAAAAAGRAPSPLCELPDGRRRKLRHVDRSFGTAKGFVSFVEAELRQGQLAFPDDFVWQDVFPSLQAACTQTDDVICFHCGKCHQLWHCLEAFPARQGELPNNVTWGYAPGVFRTRSCYFFCQNGDSLTGFEDSVGW